MLHLVSVFVHDQLRLQDVGNLIVFTLWVCVCVIKTKCGPTAAGTTTEVVISTSTGSNDS